MVQHFLKIFFFIFLVFFCVYLLIGQNRESKIIERLESVRNIQVAETLLRVRLAETKEEQSRGLGGVPFLNENEGMLFVFPDSDRNYFWMKDMNFAIDIIWFDEFQKVIYLKEDVKPETYPEVFGPDLDSKYVLEVVSGFVKKNGISVGDQLFFLP